MRRNPYIAIMNAANRNGGLHLSIEEVKALAADRTIENTAYQSVSPKDREACMRDGEFLWRKVNPFYRARESGEST